MDFFFKMSDELLKYANSSNEHKKKIFALRDWCVRQGGNFSLQEAFDCLYDYADKDTDYLTELIEQLTAKKRVLGRSSTVFGSTGNGMHLRREEDGSVTVQGVNPAFTKKEVGQHLTHNQSVLRKDGQIRKNVIAAREKLYDLGKEVREIYNGQSNEFITCAMAAIKGFAKVHKISEMSVVNKLKKGTYRLSMENGIENALIVPNNKTIKLTESQVLDLSDATKLTEYKFYNNVQRFLSELLKDPVGTKVPFLLKANNIDRNQLLYHLKRQGIINRHSKISDTDSEGNPKTAKMVIRYSVPKKDFAKKMKKLFIALVAKNVPEKIEKIVNKELDECDCGGAMGATAGNESMGQYSQPIFGVQRRKMPTEIDETTTASNVTPNGDTSMGISVPLGADKETMNREPGFSVERQDESINEYLDKSMSDVRKKFKGKEYAENGFSWSEDADDGKEIVHNEWMIHFSNDAQKISQEGFTQGNGYEGKLKSATYRRVKADGGYNYAYLATDVLSNPYGRFVTYLKDRLTPFIMFKGNGYRFYHEQDGENQVVFNNVQKDTKVLIMSLYDQWCVLSTINPDWKQRDKDIDPKQKDERFALNNTRNILNGVIYSDDDINKVIRWVMTNFEQYRNKFKY